MKILLPILGLVAVILLVCGVSFSSAYNSGNQHEQALKAAMTNNENILAGYGKKIQEAAQIPSMQRDDLVDVFTGAIEARYGQDGSQAGIQFIQEQNPNLDQSTYRQIQQMIEAGRNEFTAAQTQLVDRKRAYETELGSLWRGLWLSVAGYPRIDLDGIRIISSSRAQDAFESGVEAPLQLR